MDIFAFALSPINDIIALLILKICALLLGEIFMTLTQITYFEAVCEYKNVTKAANALFVSRSAVSRSLKELENEWNLVLFNRSRTGVELTEDGEMLRNMFREFNRAYTALKRYMNDTKRLTKASELRIGITTTTGSRFFPDFFPRFKSKYPDIALHFSEHPVYEIYDSLINGDCDFFITPHVNNDLEQCKDIEKLPIYTSELVFCVSSSHQLAQRKNIKISEISNIRRASLLTPMTPDILDNTFLGSLLDFQEDANTIIKSSQQELIRKAIACGFATSILPREIIEKWQGISIIPFDPPKVFSVYIVWNKDCLYSEVCRNFLDFVRHYDFSEF